jgi:tetratricopeptide (TPR) repeat protein
LALSPTNSEVWWVRAQFLERTGRLSDYHAALDHAVVLNATNPLVWNAKGLVSQTAKRFDEALQAFGKAIILSGQRFDADSPYAISRFSRAKLLLQMNDIAGASRDNLEALGIPARDPQLPRTLLDLSPFYNQSFDEARGEWFGTLPNIPRGRQRIAGVEFDVRGIVQLWASRVGVSSNICPTSVVGINVAQKCSRLHFLASNVYREREGATIGSFVIHHADGFRSTYPLIYGQNTRDHNTKLDQKDVAEGVGVYIPAKESSRLFRNTWNNPRPDVQIESLDFVSSVTQAGPFLIAITAEP